MLCRFCHNDGQLEDLASVIVAADNLPELYPGGFWVDLLRDSTEVQKATGEYLAGELCMPMLVTRRVLTQPMCVCTQWRCLSYH